MVEGGSQQTATALAYFREEIEETSAKRDYLGVDDTAAATSTHLWNKRLRSLSKAKEYLREEIETSTTRDYLRVGDTAAATSTDLWNKRLRSLSKAKEYLREEVEET